MNQPLRRILVGVAGGATVIVGVILIPLPGPGIPVIIAGIALLATEFAWAARVRDLGRALWSRVRPASGRAAASL
jgi:uncharacterized protein (TIGR02611 family)